MHVAVSADPIFLLDQAELRPGRLRGISLGIRRGVTAVLGWSGAGKTSLLNLLSGFERPSRGLVRCEERMAWVPQSDGLWPHCTAIEHLTECGSTRADAETLLAEFDLLAHAGAWPLTLSRGEQSRLAVARAIAMATPVLVMDEPLSHVDPARAGKYWSAIRQHIGQTGASLVFATHHAETACGEAEHAICLHEGALAYEGSVTLLYNEPASEHLMNYLGPGNWLTPKDARMWLGATWPAARCVRPERMMISSTENDGAMVAASRFYGAHALTELRMANGAVRLFTHRPAGPLERGARVRVSLSPSTPQ